MTEFELARMEREWLAANKQESGNDSIWDGGLWASRNVPALFDKIKELRAALAHLEGVHHD